MIEHTWSIEVRLTAELIWRRCWMADGATAERDTRVRFHTLAMSLRGPVRIGHLHPVWEAARLLRGDAVLDEADRPPADASDRDATKPRRRS